MTTAERSSPSPTLPLIQGAGLALVLAAILIRVFTTGSGIEIHQPGTQLLFDSVALVGAVTCMLARVLERERPFLSAGLVLPATIAVCAVLAVSAAGSPNADLGWRTAISQSAVFVLAVAVRDLGRDPRLAKSLAGFVVACVTVAAALGVYEYVVEYPRLLELYRSGELDSGLALQGRGFQIAMKERIHARAAVGPFLLPGMLATATLMVIPLAGVALWAVARGPSRAASLAVPAAVAFGALVLGLMLTHSKGAAVTGCGTAGVFALLHPRAAPYRRRLLIAGGVLAAIVFGVGLAVYLINPEGYGIGLSFQVRIEYWRAGLAMWLDQPVLGNGLAGYRELYSFYKPERAEETLHAHNAAVELLAETGLVGLGAFVGLGVAWLREGLREPEPVEEGVQPTGHRGALCRPRTVALGSAFGLFLGLILLAGFGDRYSVQDDTLGHFLFIAVGVPAVAFGLTRCLERAPSPALLRAAALAGAMALCWDGLLNFGLHQSGVFTLGCVLMGLAPALGNTPARPWGPKPVSIAAAVLLGVLTVALLMGRVPAALRADVSRDRARYEHVEAARRANSGDTTGGRVLLQETLVDFDAAVADYPGDVRTWLERGSVLRSLGRSDEAVASVERAVALAPWAADLRDELGLLLLLSDTRHAIQAFDEAVRLYPSHPGYRLHAGEARARLAGEGLANEERQRVVSEAREELLNALRISEATRLVRLKLSDPETSRITKLLSELKTR